MTEERAPGLYVHVPFCRRVCPYCDFAVRTGGPRARRRYLEALLREFELVSEPFAPFDTVYFGGGTPSCLAPEALAAVLRRARERAGTTPDVWISMEANPEDVTPERLRAWRAVGVRTLSLGVQALDDAALSFLGRSHTVADAERAVGAARAAGVEIVSIDLIFGLPGQRAADWQRQLERAIALRPDHLSCYQLTVHERTPFGRRRAAGKLAELAERRQAELYLLGCGLLEAAGYEQYEVSNFAARPAARSRHNLKYWRHAPYLGLGPSAHSYDGDRRRWWNEARLDRYAGAVEAGRRPVAGSETLDDHALALETILLGLRCRAGLDLAALQRRTGVDLLADKSTLLRRWRERGLVECNGERLRPTVRGLAVADALAAELAPDPPERGRRAPRLGDPSPPPARAHA